MKTEEQGTFFTSDTHFGHENIIRYCRRPFANTVEMDQAIIERWNEAVQDDDVIYHLGDFTLRGRDFAVRILRQLRGRIRILGNHWHHDKRWLPSGFGASGLYGRSKYEVEILPPLAVRNLGGRVLVMCHYPLGEWDRKHHGAWHLHGHSHGTHRGYGALLDAGVDCHGFHPIPFASLEALMPAKNDLVTSCCSVFRGDRPFPTSVSGCL